MIDEQKQHQILHPLNEFCDRAVGCLIGGAIGDALGYAVEFFSIDEIRSRYGQEGIQELELDAEGHAVVSDDTQMTLFTVEGVVDAIARNGGVNQEKILSSVRQQTLNWYDIQNSGGAVNADARGLMRYSVLGKSRAPGGTCMSACAVGATGTPERQINNSKGCGGVMRVAPIGLIPELSTETVFDTAARCAAQTHGHPTGYISSGVMSSIVRELLEGSVLDHAVACALEIAESWDDSDETIIAVQKARRYASEGHADRTETLTKLGEGWIAEEAIAIGLYATFVGRDYRDTVRLASNHSGDSDSTASIAGQIYGVQHGLKAVPYEWITKLDVLEPLLYVADRLIEATGHTS